MLLATAVQEAHTSPSAAMHPAAKRQRTVPVPQATPTPTRNTPKKPLELLFEEFRYVPPPEKTGASCGRL
jgi:hypothetical protein